MEKSSLLEGFSFCSAFCPSMLGFRSPLQRSKLNDNPSIGYQRERTGGELAWEELCWVGAALKMWSCWHGFYTEQLLHRGALHRGALHGRSLTQRSLYTGRTLHTETFTQEWCLHTEAFTQRSLYTDSLDTEKLAHTEAFTQRSLLHRAAFSQRSFYILHGKACTHRRFYTKKLLHRAAFTHRNVDTQKSFTHGSF